MFRTFLALGLFGLVTISVAASAEFDPAEPLKFRSQRGPVEPISETTLVAEAEEFTPASGSPWRSQPFGTNYYAATFANSFLSRQAYLGAPADSAAGAASIKVRVPAAGRYLALVRYESCYRFETKFRLQVEQAGQRRLDRVYGARSNLKIWAFRNGLKDEVAWPWGAGENVVWEGHDAAVELAPGEATLTLLVEPQQGDVARRNVDLVLLTRDTEDVAMRIQKENYLPLDGLLTQAGDVHLRVTNRSNAPLVLTIPPAVEHSPYWVHLRTWKPLSLELAPGQTGEWVEVGHLLDTLSDGQWRIGAKSPTAGGAIRYQLEFAEKQAGGKIAPMGTLDGLTGNVEVAYDGATRYTRRVRHVDAVLDELIAYLKRHPVVGKPLQETLFYAFSFVEREGDAAFNAKVHEFVRLIGGTGFALGSRQEIPTDGGLVRGYIDVRSVPTPKLAEYCQTLVAEGKSKHVAVVSLGDEIGLPNPPASDHAGFRAWLGERGLKPADVDPAATTWEQLEFSPQPATKETRPGVYYWSKIYAFRYGIRQLRERTEILRAALPNAQIGANFSPHHGYHYLGPTYHWISTFREGGMTMPWGEDYIWQVPMGTQQMNSIVIDMYRAGIRNRPEAKIHYYVMPHTPGNTTDNWRRQFYLDLAHGVKIFNLFEFRPVQHAYTENHCSDPAMFQAVRTAIHELGTIEDIVQAGQIPAAKTGLWFSEAADIWDDNRAPFASGKRTLYIALRQAQVPLDVVVEGDDLAGYETIYLTDRHVSRAASQALAAWVDRGGRLVATAGAGMFDELEQPNSALRTLLGVDESKLDLSPLAIDFEKQDLPFSTPLAHLAASTTGAKIPVFGAISRLKVTSAQPRATFEDGSPAVTGRSVGKGEAVYVAYLPGLSYFAPALPRIPVDRGAVADTLSHFIPTAFGPTGPCELPATGFVPPIECSTPLVESTRIDAKQGTLIPLINWTPSPLRGLTVTVRGSLPSGGVTLASGGRVEVSRMPDRTIFTLDLNVADALVIRP